MTSRKQLGLIFGPLLTALLIVVLIFTIPNPSDKYSEKELNVAAVGLTTDVYKGVALKNSGLQENFVPFFGSSELSRIDPFHPSTLAVKYNRPYRPFLIGEPGAQSITHFFAMQGIESNLKDKKAVFIISPQWFTPGGQREEAFNTNYSPLGVMTWLLSAGQSSTDQYAAKRLMALRGDKNNFIVTAALKRVAKGQKITMGQRLFFKFRQRMLQNEDSFFSRFSYNRHWDNLQQQAKLLPDKYSESELDKLATKIGRQQTRTNTLGIKDYFYKNRLPEDVMTRLKGSQRKLNYIKSKEFGDLQLVLNQFAEQNTNVLLIIPPVNGKWAAFTGLSQEMYQTSVGKIKYQLRQQGFTNILDLSKDGGEEYFVQDTIHVGWRGWVRIDQTVRPFLENEQPAPNYHLDDKFLGQKWQRASRAPAE